MNRQNSQRKRGRRDKMKNKALHTITKYGVNKSPYLLTKFGKKLYSKITTLISLYDELAILGTEINLAKARRILRSGKSRKRGGAV